jgi:hypothetical protein
MSFTIYCCGTSSNSFDALGDMEREVDEWDKKPKEFEELWKKRPVGGPQRPQPGPRKAERDL